jgi:hypothetical protein
MFAILNNPEYWNKRADQAVLRLAQARDQDERAMLLRLHADYVRIACAAAVRAMIGVALFGSIVADQCSGRDRR